MNILTEYPIWFLVFCLAAGFAFASALYFRERKSEFPASAKMLMAVIRFVTVSLISFLLLSPLFKMQVKIQEKPKLLIFKDNSRSVLQTADSTFYRNEFSDRISELMDATAGRFEPVLFEFAGEVNTETNADYDGARTNISAVFNFIDDRYSNRNIGAVVLATDGIYNTGANPLYAGNTSRYPLYSIALGDTNTIPDVRINKLNFNEIAFLGNEFPLEVNIHADKSSGKRLELVVRKEGRAVVRENFEVDDDSFNRNFNFFLKAEDVGLQQYSVEVSSPENELNKDNNIDEFYIDVINTRQKILILYHAPHPDIAALRSVLEENRQYEVEVFALDGFDKNVEQYNLLIFHQLPSSSVASVSLRKQTDAADIPVLYVVGSQTNLGFFNNMSAGLKITASVEFEDAFPAFRNDFNLFALSEELKNSIDQWPPLQVHFGNYLLDNSAYVMMNQRIGSLVTDKPLIAFNAAVDEKSAVIAGEGIWRWRMKDHALNQNQDNFDELFGKIVRYLSIQADKKQFRLSADKLFNEFEEVEFDASLYNESYELVNEPEVELVIKDSTGKNYPFVMGRKDDAYYLNAGNFPVGEYDFSARVEWNADTYSDKGTFRVRKSNLENLQLSADHNLLYRLSRMHEGSLFYPSQISELENELVNSDATSVVSYKQEYTELLNIPWLLMVLILLLGAEWFMRKWNGSY